MRLPAPLLLVVAASLLLLLPACHGGNRGEVVSISAGDADIGREAECGADSVIDQMPLRMQIGQLFLPAIYASGDEVTIDRALNYARETGVGGLVLLK